MLAARAVTGIGRNGWLGLSALVGAMLAGCSAYPFSDGPTSVPSCSWPLEVHGSPTADQVKLVKCYVKGLATNDHSTLRRVAYDAPPVEITAADFLRAADAHSGEASATFVQNPDDDADVEVTLRFADGARFSVEMDLQNPASAHSWRLRIGTDQNQDTNAPAPTLP